MRWTPWKDDMAVAIKAKAHPKTLILNKIDVELLVDLDDVSHKLISKDNAFVQKLKKACDQISDAAVADMERLIRRADSQAKGFDQQLAGLFLRPITTEMEHRYDSACKKLEQEATKIFEEYRKGHDSLKKSTIRIDLDGDFQGPTIQFDKKAVGTGGAKLPPIHVFGMLKDSGQTMRECYNLSAAVSNVGLLIKRELTTLQDVLKAKAKTGGADIKLEDDDRAKKCKAHISQFQVNFKKLETHWTGLAEKIEGASHAEHEWEKKFNSTKSKLLADKAKKIEATLKKATLEIGIMVRNAQRITAEIKTLEKSYPKFDTAYNALIEGGEWAKEVPAALAVDIEIHKDIKQADEAIKRGLQMVKVAEESIGKENKP